MSLTKFLKIQLTIYLFILIFGFQHLYFKEFDYRWTYYEHIFTGVFALSVLVVLSSLVILITESIKIWNRPKIDRKEVIILSLNLGLYYLVAGMSLFLSTQMR